uniref:Protein kinase domain-containing protein n=1 Tax=Daphnia galeata TaxID=27404 RepID=A0A8J2VYQ8_9CRUS|nr:unnamed protein product [Daphnia galeata]
MTRLRLVLIKSLASLCDPDSLSASIFITPGRSTATTIRYYIFDLAPCSLYYFCQGNYTGKIPSDGEALKQMAKGLFYIHRQQFVHRDIKPSNIFISKNEPVKLMLANFSLYVDDDEPAKTFTISSDTWALGCAFFYFLTRGIHPFGTNSKKIRYNMLVKQRPSVEFETRFKTLQSSNNEMVEVYQLIRDMIKVEPSKRIPLELVIEKLERIYPADSS